MNNATIKRLLDARAAAGDIISFTTSLTLDMYQQDYQLRLAVERLITIVGEAMAYALRFDNELKKRIPDAQSSIEIRNRIIHGYDSVDNAIVWSASTVSIPILLEQINEVLNKEGYV